VSSDVVRGDLVGYTALWDCRNKKLIIFFSVNSYNIFLTRRVSISYITKHHVTRHNKPIHNILSTAPQLSISQKALGTLPDDGNVMPKHVELPYIINKLN
jgi:hypothetical protein